MALDELQTVVSKSSVG